MDTRIYLIILTSEIDEVIFDEILQTSVDTIRKNLDETKFIISWDGTTPSFVDGLQTKSAELSHEEILFIVNNVYEWNYQNVTGSTI
jgi:hypothetical protein